MTSLEISDDWCRRKWDEPTSVPRTVSTHFRLIALATVEARPKQPTQGDQTHLGAECDQIFELISGYVASRFLAPMDERRDDLLQESRLSISHCSINPHMPWFNAIRLELLRRPCCDQGVFVEVQRPEHRVTGDQAKRLELAQLFGFKPRSSDQFVERETRSGVLTNEWIRRSEPGACSVNFGLRNRRCVLR